MNTLTHHAKIRCAQRGIQKTFLSMLMSISDIEIPIGNNCRLLKVSYQKALGHRQRDKLCKYAVIFSDTSNVIVTVMPIHLSKAGNHYRRKSA